MKKWLLSLALIIAIAGLTACGDKSDTVVETKHGNITQNDFYDEMKKSVGPQVLLNLIYSTILPEKYEVDKKEFDEKYEQFRSLYGENYEVVLAQAGLTDKDIRRSIELDLLIGEVEKKAIKNIKVTDEEIKEYYDENYPQIHARHILVEDKETAEEIKKKLENGEKFEELAKEYSTDTGSAQNGGDLDWFGPGKMVKEFSDVAFSLEKNEISDPVETQHGFHIIQVLDKKKKPKLEDVKKEITDELKQQKYENNPEILDEALKKEMEEAGVKIKDKKLKKLIEQ